MTIFSRFVSYIFKARTFIEEKIVWSKKFVIFVAYPFVFSFIEMGLKIKCLSYYSLLDSNIGPQKMLTNSLKVGFLYLMIKQSFCK